MRTHLRAKGLIRTRGDDVLKLFSISYMYNTKSNYFSPKIKQHFMEIEIQMQNHKIETNSELIYEDGSI